MTSFISVAVNQPSAGFASRSSILGANLYSHDDIVFLFWRFVDAKSLFSTMVSFPRKTCLRSTFEMNNSSNMCLPCSFKGAVEALSIVWLTNCHLLAPHWRRMCFSKHLGFFVNESVIYNIVDSLIKTSWYDHLRKNRSLFWSYWTWKTKPHFANSLGQSAVLFGVRFRRVRRRRHNLLFAFNAYNLPLFWTQFNFFQFLHARTFPAHWSGRFWLVDILSAEASVHHVITALLLITFACQALSMKEKAPTACDILIG